MDTNERSIYKYIITLYIVHVRQGNTIIIHVCSIYYAGGLKIDGSYMYKVNIDLTTSYGYHGSILFISC